MFNFIKTLICLVFAAVILIVSAFWAFAGLNPSVDLDATLNPDAASRYFDDQGTLIHTTASEEQRVLVKYEQLPEHLKQAFISIEDARFYSHGGIDFYGTARALYNNLTGGTVQGGSTLTQQLARNAFLSHERTLTRKLKEAYISRQLEECYTKDEILTMYLNRIYFGQGTYGVEAASMYYFGKHIEDITLAESAVLAAIPKSPTYYDPVRNPKNNKARQELVLSQMTKYGYITPEQEELAKAETIELHTVKTQKKKQYLSYFFDHCNQFIIKEFGADALYKEGLKIYTTINSKMQEDAVNALKYLPKYYVDQNKLTQPQVALVALDPTNGYIKAMIGGRSEDKFNRATMAVRQPGSAFKPFVYLTAMNNGFTPASVIEDKETEFPDEWIPQNNNKKFHGKVSLRSALKRSLNVPTILLAQEVGVYKIVTTSKKLGISTLVEKGKYSDVNLSMAIGGLTNGVTPLEMAAAYGAIANAGVYVEPVAITRVEDRYGKVLYENQEVSQRAVSPEAAYLTVDMMKDVFTSGTATGAGIGRPAGGKTGTTDDYRDAWFVGFTPNLSTAVWIGDDNGNELREMYGSGEPLRIWHDFMYYATKELPEVDFEKPEGLEIPPEPELKTPEELEAERLEKERLEAEEKLKALEEEEKAKEKEKKKDKKKRKRKRDRDEDDEDDDDARSSMRQRIKEILGESGPIISNKPTPIAR